MHNTSRCAELEKRFPGLIAAIPAVVIYNVFARAITGYRASLADLSAALMRLVSRDLDRRGTVRAAAAE